MTDEIAGRDGRDRIQHVEAVLFDDGYRLSLTGANNNPYAVADSAVTTEGNSVLIDVLANDFDPDTTIFDKSTTLSLASVGPTSNGGTVTINAGKVLYDPGAAFDFLDAGMTATDTFHYTISDGKSGIFTATATVTVAGTSTSLANLDGTNGFRLDGEAPYDFSGNSVASAGDVNGDGFDDLIIGAHRRRSRRDMMPARAMWCSARRAGFAADARSATLNGTNGFRLIGIDAGRPQRLFGRLGRRRERRRLRRSDHRGASRRSGRRRLCGRELCGVRQGGGLRGRHRSCRR